jgi:hypothetical protein
VMADAAEKLELTPELEAKIVSALSRVWDDIADDYFKLAAGQGWSDKPKRVSQVRISRKEVAEAAGDAGRAVSMGLLTQEEYNLYLGLPKKDMDRIHKTAFPDGWHTY